MSTTKTKTDVILDVTLRAGVARWLSEVVLSSASKDETTPVLVAGLLVADGDRVRVVATDRYRLVTAVAGPVLSDVATSVLPDGNSALLHIDDWAWIKKNAFSLKQRGFSSSEPTVRIEVHGAEFPKVAITVDQYGPREGGKSLTYTSDVVKGNFPPVLRLIEEARGAEIETSAPFLNPRKLADVARIGKHPDETMRLKPTVSTKPDTPGPVLLTWGDDKNPHAEALIMPIRAH